MEFVLDPKVREIINNYIGYREPLPVQSKGLERICVNELRTMAQEIFDKIATQKLYV